MSRLRQSCIGMALASAIMAAWLCVHVVGIFFFQPAAHPLAALLLIAVQTWLSVGLYIIAHDAMHGSLCPARRDIGNAVGAVALALYACFSFRRLLPMHHAHHRSPGSEEDPDFAPASPSRAPAWYGRFLATYVSKREVLLMLSRVGIYLLLGALLENIVLFFALPGILSSLQLFYFGTYLPHRHLPGGQGSRFADRHRSRSNDYGWLMSLLTCFHFGYHHEHHLEPGMPWWRLPETRGR